MVYFQIELITLVTVMLVHLSSVTCEPQPQPQQYRNEEYPKYGNRGGIVDVDVHDTDYGGKHVGVHVPLFYKMDLDKDPLRTGLGINVLDGLVKVRVKKDPFKKDDVFVALGGIPLWYSK